MTRLVKLKTGFTYFVAMRKQNLLKLLLFPLLVCLAALTYAQKTTPESIKTFDKGGLKFSYPADWKLIDRSTTDNQDLLLTKENLKVLIMIFSPVRTVQNEDQFAVVQTQVLDQYVKG